MSAREIILALVGMNAGLGVAGILDGAPAWVWIINLMSGLLNAFLFLSLPRGES